MDGIRVIHDPVGKTPTIWLDEPTREASCQETEEEIVLMKDAGGKLIEMEILHYDPASSPPSVTVELAQA